MGGGIKRKSGVRRGCGQHPVLDIAGQYCTPCHREGRATNGERIKEIEEIMATDRSQMLNLVAGMSALAAMLIEMRAEEVGKAPEDTLAELGRRIQELQPGSG